MAGKGPPQCRLARDLSWAGLYPDPLFEPQRRAAAQVKRNPFGGEAVGEGGKKMKPLRR